MNEEEYIKKRLQDQINWYSTKSLWNQKWFKRLKVLEIVCAAIIPFIAGMGSIVPYYQFVIGFLGVIIAVSSGISSIYKFHENWIEYRTTAETLKHELYLFQTKSQPYDKENAFQELVQRVESLISKEHTQWSRYAWKQKE